MMTNMTTLVITEVIKMTKMLLSRGREAWNGDKYRCERTHCIGKAGIVTDGLLTRLAELEVLHNWWGKVGAP